MIWTFQRFYVDEPTAGASAPSQEFRAGRVAEVAAYNLYQNRRGVGVSLKLPRSICERLLDEARKALPDECCGLLAGRRAVVERMYAAINQLASPVAYEIAPRELFDIFRDLRAHGLELVGIYHSHPQSDNAPSQRDLELAYYPEVAYVIISPLAGAPRPLRVFRLREGGWEEEPAQVTE